MTGTKGIIIDPWCPTFVDRCTPGAHFRALRFAAAITTTSIMYIRNLRSILCIGTKLLTLQDL